MKEDEYTNESMILMININRQLQILDNFIKRKIAFLFIFIAAFKDRKKMSDTQKIYKNVFLIL